MVPAYRIVLLLGAGVALLVVALTNEDPTYVAPTRETSAPHRPAPPELSRPVPSGCVVRTVEVAGMCCDGCTGKLFELLTAIPEVRDAAVSFDAGRAQAVVPADFDAHVLEAVLTQEKYTARLVTSD